MSLGFAIFSREGDGLAQGRLLGDSSQLVITQFYSQATDAQMEDILRIIDGDPEVPGEERWLATFAELDGGEDYLLATENDLETLRMERSTDLRELTEARNNTATEPLRTGDERWE